MLSITESVSGGSAHSLASIASGNSLGIGTENESGDETKFFGHECKCGEKNAMLDGEWGSHAFYHTEEWESERYAILWKLKWLQSQFAEVNNQVSLCNQKMNSLRKSKARAKEKERKERRTRLFSDPSFPTWQTNGTDPLFLPTDKRKRYFYLPPPFSSVN